MRIIKYMQLKMFCCSLQKHLHRSIDVFIFFNVEAGVPPSVDFSLGMP